MRGGTIGYTTSGEVSVVGVVSCLSPPRDPERYRAEAAKCALRGCFLADPTKRKTWKCVLCRARTIPGSQGVG
ncbi:MAG: hypothetical protein AAF802_30320, partial [Planctomycetota bacterium]